MIDTMAPEAPARPRRSRTALRAVAAFVLGGLTSMELLALIVGFVAVMGLLWASNAVAPETLVTEPWLRSAWILSVVAVVRPLTWIPYAAVFVGLDRVVAWAGPDVRRWRRRLLAHAGTLAILSGCVGLLFLVVPSASRWTLSSLGFVAGTVSIADLGMATGRWAPDTVTAVAAAFVLIRPVVPPVGLDLDLAARPFLGFVDGGRGRFDKGLTITATVVAVAAGVAAWWLSGRG
ncbi:MAG TPA: hypothetical protein VGA30_00600 [Actinomycetota bacterium]